MSDIHDQLIEVVGQAPDREWIEEFLEYADELLSYEEITHHEGDNRLVTSLLSDRIAITMNSRYVLTARFDRQQVGFIIRSGSEQVEELAERAEVDYSFGTLPDEEEGESPDWLEFTDAFEHLSNDSIRKNWLTASSIEFDRWSGSPSKNAHEPLVQRMITSEEYRTKILDEAFHSA